MYHPNLVINPGCIAHWFCRRFWIGIAGFLCLIGTVAGADKTNLPNVDRWFESDGEAVQQTSGAIPGGVTPFWRYAIFGYNTGSSNIVVGPPSGIGDAREIIVGGNASNAYAPDAFWQAIRYNPLTGGYDPLFVSSIYSARIMKIALGNVVGDSQPEIVVMLQSGRIYLYDFATKTEVGVLSTGINDLQGLNVSDLDGDGLAELIVTTDNDLFVFNSAGTLLWQVAGAGGYEIAVGQMDNDPALEIATTKNLVIDAATHAAQWTHNGNFGMHLRLAPLPGANYQQLIAAQSGPHVYSYDVANQSLRWSISTTRTSFAIEVADVDNDGVPELLIGDDQWGAIHVYDLISQTEKWSVNNPEFSVRNIAVGDVDNDGVVDLLWASAGTATYLYIANTTGAHNIKWHSLGLDGPLCGPAIGDLDGDGKPELVICSFKSNGGADSGRILVFDLATMGLRAISAPVVGNGAWYGVHDVKLRDLDADGRMEILIAADQYYDGAIEIYGFNSSNVFTLKWANTPETYLPSFNLVDLADLDSDGTPEIIAGDAFFDPPGFVYIYDYPINIGPPLLALPNSTSVTDLVIGRFGADGALKIAALGTAGDLYTFDGRTRQLEGVLTQAGRNVVCRRWPLGLIWGDNTGFGHFLEYAADHTYTEKYTRRLGASALDGINMRSNGELWTGWGGSLNLRVPPNFDEVVWQSSTIGKGCGHVVATDYHDNQNRVFTSSIHTVSGFLYETPLPLPEPTPTPVPTVTPSTPTPSPSPGCELPEGFEYTPLLETEGWAFRNNSQPIGIVGWAQGNATRFTAHLGPINSFIAAERQNGGGGGTISNWMMTPPLTLRNGATMSFYTRTMSQSQFPDRLQVRMSTNGTSIDVGTTATSLGDFTTLLLDINPTYTTSGYPRSWTKFTVTINGVASPLIGRLAFRYFADNLNAAQYIGIDTVQFCNFIAATPTPPPTPTPTPTVTPSPTLTPTPTPTPTLTPTPTQTPSPILVATITLPTETVASSATTLALPVLTSEINPADNLIGFQGDLLFDETVVTFQSLAVSAAGVTGPNWNLLGNILPGPGPIRTLRISAFASDFTPLSGSGALFNLNMTRVSNTPGASTLLAWASLPNSFFFIDSDLEIQEPGRSPPGSITIAIPAINISGNIASSMANADPVPEVLLSVTGSGSSTTLSDNSGNYTSSALVMGGSYVVTPTKSPLPPGSSGINTVDLIAIQRHFLNLALLTGDRLRAADVNGDGSINTVDVIAIQRFFIGLSTGIANVGRYEFTPLSRSYSNLVSEQLNQNYDALIFGDVALPFVEP